jgi:polar amino acid transport system substrate-binding protein
MGSRHWRWRAIVLLAVVGLSLSWLVAGGNALAQERSSVRGGWYPWDPYQYVLRDGDRRVLTGLDVQLFRAVFEDQLDMELALPEIGWQEHQRQLRSGESDVAGGAFRTPERETYAYFSAPYRQEEVVLYCRRGDARCTSPKALGQELSHGTGRLGFVPGYYYGEQINRFITDPANAARLLPASDDLTNLANLQQRRIDLVPIDRVVGATLVWRNNWSTELKGSGFILFRGPIHALFSKRSTSPELVEQFNTALAQLRRDGRYNRIVRNYLFPVLLNQTVGQDWFLGLELLGTVAFALSGVLLAHRDQFSLFGALVLAALPAVGGGLMRDLLVNRDVPGLVRSPIALIVVVSLVLVAFLLVRLLPAVPKIPRMIKLSPVVELLDAVGLAAFTVVGVIVAVEARCEPLLLWGPVLSALTTAGGTVLRDVVRGDPNHPALRRVVYAEIAMGWGLVLSLFLSHYANSGSYDPLALQLAVLGTLIGCLLTRLAVLQLKLSAPRFG